MRAACAWCWTGFSTTWAGISGRSGMCWRTGKRSAYRDWFHNLRFEGRSPYNDPFQYEGWNGHASLVKLNLSNPAVREHLFQAVESWVRDYQIDGLRLDAADCLDW